MSLDPPLHENLAFISHRNAHLSPATRVLIEMAREHLRSLASDPKLGASTPSPT